MDCQIFIEESFKAINKAFYDGSLPTPNLIAGRIFTPDHEEVAGMFHDPETSRLDTESTITTLSSIPSKVMALT